jgi:hypothetical protein
MMLEIISPPVEILQLFECCFDLFGRYSKKERKIKIACEKEKFKKSRVKDIGSR